MDKVTYFINRIFQMIPTVIIITVLVFFMVRLIPGDPAEIMLGLKATPEKMAMLNQRWGLDKPMHEQFFLFIRNIFIGDLGTSLVNRIPVLDIIKIRLPLTLFLSFYAAFLAIIISVPLSLISSLNRDTWIDQVIRWVIVTALSTPTFWFGIVLMIIFSVKIQIFPVGGVGNTFSEKLFDLFLPALTLSLHMMAVLTRNLRDGIISMLRSEHVVFARAKGLAERLVMLRHVLRNAMVSGLTIVGIYMSWLVGGSVVIESVFALPGMGFTMIQSIMGRDYPMVQGLTLTFGILVSFVYLITDIIYSFLDPRVTL